MKHILIIMITISCFSKIYTAHQPTPPGDWRKNFKKRRELTSDLQEGIFLSSSDYQHLSKHHPQVARDYLMDRAFYAPAHIQIGRDDKDNPTIVFVSKPHNYRTRAALITDTVTLPPCYDDIPEQLIYNAIEQKVALGLT